MSKSTLNSGRTGDKLKFLRIVDAGVLSAACRGEIDLNLMAREELAKRGLDEDGRWVGFEKSLLSLIEYKSARPMNRGACSRPQESEQKNITLRQDQELEGTNDA